MSRLFTFGCSFTWWPWPTWADIIAYDLNMPHYNWALPGLGNVGIHARMVECDIRNNFNEDDLILVVWSSWTREDRYGVKQSNLDASGWNCTGDILRSYDRRFIDNYWSVNNDLVKNSTAIISANKMYNIKFNGHISTPLSSLYNNSSLSFNDNEKSIATFYQPYIPNDGEYQENGKHKCKYTKTNDSHPDILAHLDYTKEFIETKLQRPLSKTTIDYFTEMHYTLYDYTENVMDTSDGKDYRQKIRTVLLEKFNWQYSKNEGF